MEQASRSIRFVGDRLIRRIAVQSSAGEVPLEAASRNPTPWSDDEKRVHIGRGYDLLDELLVERAVA
jgi:hypothetical protein